MKKSVLRKYARLIVNVGVRVRKGQDVVIRAELDQPAFVRTVAEECYRAGARLVRVEWEDRKIRAISLKRASEKALSETQDYEIARMEYRRDTLPCMIYLVSEDPDGLAGVDERKMTNVRQARIRAVKAICDEMEEKYQWCIAAVPCVEWAKKVFPHLSATRAVERLWEAILETSRVTDDPIAAWEAHNRDLAERCRYLNGLGIRTLRYRAKNGTDFTVGLMEESRFLGGGEYTLSGNYYNPNIPSEEVFTSPDKNTAEGLVVSSRPLVFDGQMIDNFSLRFHAGRVTELHAEVGEELLKKLIEMDEGAARLGEVALVPYNSPVRESGILFYNTLFDENAACHLALGMGFNGCVRDFEKYTREELERMGLNNSLIHEDFMIGTEDLSVSAITKDGKEIPVFRNGNWAF